MTKRRGLPTPDDPAWIGRELRFGTETLRVAEVMVRARLYKLEEREARRLLELYLQAYKSMAGTLGMAYGGDGTPDLRRRAELLRQLELEIRELARQTGQRVDEALLSAFQQGYAGHAWALDMATNPEVVIRLQPVLPREAIRALLAQPLVGRSGRYMGADWHAELGLSFEEFNVRVKRALTFSMIQGEGMAQAQRRLRDELGIQTDRRKGFKRNFYQTLLLTRTEMMRASNLGALTVYEQNQDILRGWEWVSARDERVCPVCGGLDGKVFDFSQNAMQPPSGSHPGCRCTVAPALRDQALADRVFGGPRQTYEEWAAERGLLSDAQQLPF
jgi:SPP1 gp7 family putative phage head morphogenesis protein